MRIFGLDLSLKKRSIVPNASDDYWYNTPSSSSATGLTVNAETAMRNTAVYACVKVLSESIAMLPLILYKRLPNGGKERDTEHPLYRLLHDEPNRWMTSFEFREMLMGHCLLRGNGYARIVYSNAGIPIELVPLHPTRVTPMLKSNGDLYYQYISKTGGTMTIAGEEMFHLRGMSSDGLVGSSAIQFTKEAIGLALATEEYGARLFGSNARPSGILTHPGKIDENAAKRLKDSWRAAHSGLGNSHNTAILEEGMKWEQVGMSSEDAQFLETRKFQLEEIARIFRVPPHMIGDLSRSTFSNIEHQSIEFVVHTLLPWVKRWENAICRTLLSEEEKKIRFFEFLVDGLLRGDLKTRYEAYAIGRNNGWLSADDVRVMENMNPLEDDQGDIYLVPVNMVNAASLVGKTDTVEDNTETENDVVDPESENNSMIAYESRIKRDAKATYFVLMKAAIERILRKEVKALTTGVKRDGFWDKLEKFKESNEELMVELILPIVTANTQLELKENDALDLEKVKLYCKSAAKEHTERLLRDLKATVQSVDVKEFLENRILSVAKEESEQILGVNIYEK